MADTELKLLAKGESLEVNAWHNGDKDKTATLSIVMPAKRLDAWLMFLRGMVPDAELAKDCVTKITSSAMCAHGTRGCEVDHGAQR